MGKMILLLEDGRWFEGSSFGFQGETIGEVCFNTGMTGYQEILTDPSYCKQIVIMTAPHIGNYGINSKDIESYSIQVAGFVIKEESLSVSNWRSTITIGEYLKEEKIVGIKGIDTRALASHIRDYGAMNGIISTASHSIETLMKKLKSTPNMVGLDLVKKVTCKEKYTWAEHKPEQLSVAVIDFGIKHNMLRLLKDYGCNITIFPANISASDLIDFCPDGVFLSNGPGDPAAVSYAIETVQSLIGKIPIFGICLGHQILALALGAKTFKLKFGHRGLNHPVKNIDTGVIEITSQNHGFAVDLDSLPKNVVSTHINLNDNTSAGLRCDENFAFSVQYHPESSPGPHDSRYLFKDFISLMKNAKKN
tara:strand:- start:37 stop:1128 length:1092 start_codon:yes stop_codon:yes gene_type:complete